MSQAVAPPPRLAALRSPDFRRLWLGEMVSTVGSQMQIVAIDWHVATLLTGQSVVVSETVTLNAQALGLGLIGLSRVIPIILFALVGGVLADAVDRRKLMVTTRIIAALFASLLALITLTGHETVGVIYLFTAAPVGSVLAGVIVALRRDIQNQGKVLLVSVAVYGIATALFGLSTGFILSYFFYALTGAGDTVSTVIRGTLRQLLTPDYLRGRMTSVNMIFFMGGPQLGELEAGLVAAAFGAPFAIVTGGIATVFLTAWIAWKYPRLRNYTRASAIEAIPAT